jgi:hypothetical protein
MTYLILGVVSAIVALLASLVIAWAVKHTPVDRYEDGEQSDRDVQAMKDSMRGTL